MQNSQTSPIRFRQFLPKSLCFLLIAFSACFGGCVSYKPVKAYELAGMERQHRWFADTFYVRSDNRYHYFRNEKTDIKGAFELYTKKTYYKASVDELTLTPKLIQEAQTGDREKGTQAVIEKDADTVHWIAMTWEEYRAGVKFKIKQVGKTFEIYMVDSRNSKTVPVVTIAPGKP